ncbi:PriCT-2 domain-containing protein [Synechococcus sp. MIT S9504]|uniref:PriCT-2 domain-containing protein n=2 Tax=Synechococcus sp. MIT S9504 TaxID=1801628 RepID=UPI000836181C
MATAPEWLLTLMLAPVITPDETPTSSCKPFTDAERTRQFLKKEFVPTEQFCDYETWLSIGMAVHDVSRECGKPDLLLPDWIAWCEGMPNFDEGECLREWSNWTAKGVTEPRLTFRSLVDRVKKLGGDILHDADWHPIKNARPGGFLERGRQYVLRNAEQLKTAVAEWNRSIREAPQTEEEKEAAKSQGCRRHR